MSFTDHGIPVRTTVQWTTALVPRPDGKWAFIAACFYGFVDELVEWIVIDDVTGTPSITKFFTTTHDYPNSNYQHYNQFRGPDGRVFYLCFSPRIIYLEPTDLSINELDRLVEDPPVDPNDSTIFYKGSFDTTGAYLYLTTQESEYRPSCVVRLDTDALTYEILGYVGEDSESYTTYGYHLAPDTVTASKWVYVVFGQDPWQLWAIDLTPGPTYLDKTKLYEVTAEGRIGDFTPVVGKGWRVTIHTNYGELDDVITHKWMINGALEDDALSVDPSDPRDVVPYENPLTDPPDLDTAEGYGAVGWRFGADPFEYVNYTAETTGPVLIRNLVPSNNGILGHGDTYTGLFRIDEPDYDESTWYGPLSLIEKGPHLNVDGIVYMSGYPNGVVLDFDPDAPFQRGVNPRLLGYVGLNGSELAGTKASTFMAWAPNAGDDGRVIIAGQRDRNGVGAGIGSFDRDTEELAGDYEQDGMDEVVPAGLAVCSAIDRIVMSTTLLEGSPSPAKLFKFDYDFNLISALEVFEDAETLGCIYETSTPNVITGIVNGEDDALVLWQWNASTDTLISDVTVPGIVGVLEGEPGFQARRPGTSDVYVLVGNQLVVVDIDALTAEVVADVTPIQNIRAMAFAADGDTLFFAGGVNETISGAQVFSLVIEGDGDVVETDTDVRVGDAEVELANDEGAALLLGQPVYASGDGKIRLACADVVATSLVQGVVVVSSIETDGFGAVRCEGPIMGTPDQWDAVCGTTGGLTYGTVYYLSESTPGRLTATPPSTGLVVPVIKALSSVQAVIEIRLPVGI